MEEGISKQAIKSLKDLVSFSHGFRTSLCKDWDRVRPATAAIGRDIICTNGAVLMNV